MHTNTLCIRLVTDQSPYAYRVLKNPRTHTGIHLQSIQYAYGIFRQSPYAYGDAIMPVCIQGSMPLESPYAYCDLTNPDMRTGICLCPRMRTGISVRSITVHVWGSQYAYGDVHMHTVSPRTHTVIISLCQCCLQ